jgi:acetyltransferase-like isoleucine patch superfamily enzyme
MDQLTTGGCQVPDLRSKRAPHVQPASGRPSAVAQFVAAQGLSYLTNHLVNRVPSFTLRHFWYRHVLGLALGRGTGIQLGVHIWFHGRRQIRSGLPTGIATLIGGRTRISRDCTLDTRGGLRIGRNVSVAPEVAILTAEHDHRSRGFRIRHAPVVIEDHVSIGMRAIILPGVHIGQGAVVAAGSVVTHDVDPLTVVAGVPARVIGERNPGALDYQLPGPFPLFE